MSLRALSLALAGVAAPALAQLAPGTPYREAIECGSVKAELIVHQDETPGGALVIGEGRLPVEGGPSYLGPVCVTRDGHDYVGFTEFMGNAYETYRLVDPETMAVEEIAYDEAERLGWWD